MDLVELKAKKVVELTKIAEELGVSDYSNLKKQDLIYC